MRLSQWPGYSYYYITYHQRDIPSIQRGLIIGHFAGPIHKRTIQPAKPHSGSVQDEVYKLRRETLIQLDASPLTRSRRPSHTGPSRGTSKWGVNPRHVTAHNCQMTVGVRANLPDILRDLRGSKASTKTHQAKQARSGREGKRLPGPKWILPQRLLS